MRRQNSPRGSPPGRAQMPAIAEGDDKRPNLIRVTTTTTIHTSASFTLPSPPEGPLPSDPPPPIPPKATRTPVKIPPKSSRRSLPPPEYESETERSSERDPDPEPERETPRPTPKKVVVQVPSMEKLPPQVPASNKDSSASSAQEDLGEKSDLIYHRYGVDEKMWFATRNRWCRVFAIGLLILLLLVALGVGLGVGLTQKNHKKNDSQSGGSASETFPIGSWSFMTTLQKTDTGCTSNPSTWTCFPYRSNEVTSLTWIISQGSAGSYIISSSDNPFLPSFSNVTLSVQARGQQDEHLSFTFNNTRNVIPDSSLSPSNTAASCTYQHVEWQGLLWTRRKNGTHIDVPTTTGKKFEQWPADVEVRQIANSEQGQPSCVDVSGNKITDVKTGSGNCECLYASFDTQS